MSRSPPDPAHLADLARYSACDVSDALLKLGVPGAGFVPDLTLQTPARSATSTTVTITATVATPTTITVGDAAAAEAAPSATVAPASTVLFIKKNSRQYAHIAPNIPPGTHFADLTVADTIVVVRQPEGQANAVCGGIVAARMRRLGARGVVVLGRVRDLPELRETNMPIWSLGTSTVGASLSSTPLAVQVPLHIPVPYGSTTAGSHDNEVVVVQPGDIVVGDPAAGGGVVVVPRDKLAAVLDLLPRLTAADERVKQAVGEGGMSLAEAFAEHRANV